MMSNETKEKGGSNRPEDSPFKQQRLEAWQPILTPKWVIGTFVFVGVLFLPLGGILFSASNSVVELVTPDGYDAACKVGSSCTVKLKATADMKAPIFVYYELANFYQNHRRYVKSRSDLQLRAAATTEASLQSACDPMLTVNDTSKQYYPCGLIATSMFNDKISLLPPQVMDETGIAWKSDLDTKFKNPDTRDESKYIYLDQLYPGIVSAFNSSDPQKAGTGVLNEHFVVWMRTAGLPTFRKLYGRITADVKKDQELQFTIDNRFNVADFSGQKRLIVSTTSFLGGKNNFLGIAYMVVGLVCLGLAAVFYAKHKISPRNLGDTQYLVWKDKQ